ncbi:MAG: hypothetical protein M3Y21_01860 [Candidatus Eremiobacteraeota bacterium]|nr:hypothetical protein [Candidatus Eremiobacteraeota bacterium]
MILAAFLLAIVTVPVLQPTPQPRPPQLAFVHHTVTTDSAAAQALFDRGLTLYYAYNGGQAVLLFEQAHKTDPKLAMSYWGEALGYGPDINTTLDERHFNLAHRAIEQAAALEGSASIEERAYIDAMRKRYSGPWHRHNQAEAAYQDAMAALVKIYPNDDDAKVLYAEALLEKQGDDKLWKPDGLPSTNDTKIIVDLLDSVLGHDPQNIMANHLTIHVFDYSTDQRRALPSADRLAADRFEPAAEHLRHMPAHTYIETGEYANAIAGSKNAIALFHRFLASPDAYREHAGYLDHDIDIGFRAAMMGDDYATALDLAKQFDDRAGGDSAQFAAMRRFYRWTDIAGAAHENSIPEHHARMAAAVAAGNLTGVATEIRALQKLKTQPTDDCSARIALLKNQPKEALAHALAAVKSQDAQFGEYVPNFPALETLGAVYYRTGSFELAESTFEKTLQRYPNDARAEFGLWQTLTKLGKAAPAAQAQSRFNALWRNSSTEFSMNDL